MNDPELKVKIEEVAQKVFNPSTKDSMKYATGSVVKFLETVTPGEYDQMFEAMYGPIGTDDNPIMPLDLRLYNLAMRLEQDGSYTNANICFLALQELRKNNVYQ